MKLTKLSPSSYNNDEQCENKFFISEFLGYREPPGVAAELGQLAHAICEYLALIKKSIQDEVFKVDKFDLITEYHTVEEVDISLIYSKVTEHFISKAFNKLSDEQIAEIYVLIDKLLETPNNPLKLNIVSTEHRFSLEIKEPWSKNISYDKDGKKVVEYLKLNGVIDLIVKEDDNTLRVIDYKTGQRKDWITGAVKDYQSLMSDIQMNMYYYYMKSTYPDYNNFIISINYLKDGGPFDLVLYDYHYKNTKKRIKEKFIKIQNMSLPMLNRSWKCRMCSYSKTYFPNPLLEFRKGQIDRQGEKACICSQTHIELQAKGADTVIELYKKKAPAVEPVVEV